MYLSLKAFSERNKICLLSFFPKLRHFGDNQQDVDTLLLNNALATGFVHFPFTLKPLGSRKNL